MLLSSVENDIQISTYIVSHYISYSIKQINISLDHQITNSFIFQTRKLVIYCGRNHENGIQNYRDTKHRNNRGLKRLTTIFYFHHCGSKLYAKQEKTKDIETKQNKMKITQCPIEHMIGTE